MKPETLHFTSSLPHESAKGADPSYSGLSYAEAKVGNIGGGTIFAVWNEALTVQHYGGRILSDLYNNGEIAYTTTLDTPDPVPHFKPVRPFPFETLDYRIPTYADGSPMQWWDMRETYKNNEAWMEQHIEQRTKPGKHIIFAHHNVGVGVELDLKKELSHINPGNRLIAMRMHSQALVTTLEQTPEYFHQVYGSFDPRSPLYRESTHYLQNLQSEAFATGDVIFVATEDERQATIEAVVKHNMMSREEAECKFLTVPIPIDMSKFRPDADGSERASQIEMFNRTKPEGVHLDPSKRYIATVSRRDHEKNIWDLVKAYGLFCRSNNYMRDVIPDLLVVGGPTNKPGVAEREEDMWKFIHALPEEIKRKITVLSTPLPHEDIVHIPDMEIYPSWEESYNISEKQARSAGKLVALSTVAAGHRGTNKSDTCIWMDPIPLDEDEGNWTSFLPAFEGALQLTMHDYFAHTNSPRITAEMMQVDEIRRNGMNHVHTNFSSQAVLQKTLAKLHNLHPAFFR